MSVSYDWRAKDHKAFEVFYQMIEEHLEKSFSNMNGDYKEKKCADYHH